MYSATPSKDRDEQRRKPKRIPNYSSKREQYRLMVLVAAVMLVVVLMSEAGKPKNWAWMWGNEGPQNAEVAQDNLAVDEIDTRLLPENDPIENDPHLIPLQVDLPPWEEGVGEGDDYFPGVRPSLLRAVEDDRLFKKEDVEPWYNLLGVLKETDQAVLDEASIGNVSYLQLYEQSEEYRGRLVSLKGAIRRVQVGEAPENDYQIERWYQCTLFPEGGSYRHPILVYCLDLPEGFPRDFDTYQEVTLTGFFFKRQAYSAGDGLNSAPAVLAKTVAWDTPSVASADIPPWYLLLAVVLVAIVLAVVVAIWAYSRSESRSEVATSHSISKNFDSVNLNALKDLDISATPRFPDES